MRWIKVGRRRSFCGPRLLARPDPHVLCSAVWELRPKDDEQSSDCWVSWHWGTTAHSQSWRAKSPEENGIVMEENQKAVTKSPYINTKKLTLRKKIKNTQFVYKNWKRLTDSLVVKLLQSLHNALECCKMQQQSLVPTIKSHSLVKKKKTLVQCLLQCCAGLE